MGKFRHAFVVNAEIARVWELYIDIKHLEIISPPELQIRIVRHTSQKLVEGSEVWLEGKLVTTSHWHSKITLARPYIYVDEMVSGRFKLWRHVHEFKAVDDNTTEVIDEIDFELPFGILGRLFDGYVYLRLGRTFAYRKDATIEALTRSKLH